MRSSRFATYRGAGLILLIVCAVSAQESRYDNGRALNRPRSAAVQSLVTRGAQLALDDRLQESESLLKRALKLDPHYLRAHIEYRNVLLNFAGERDRVNEEYSRLVKNDPDNPVYLMALYLHSDGNYGRNELQKITRLVPEWAWAHYAAALLALNSDPQKSAAEFRKCIAIDPLAIEAYSRLIELQETQLKSINDAISTAEMYAAVPSLRANALPVLWRLRLKQGDNSEASKNALREELKTLSESTRDIRDINLLSAIRSTYSSQLRDHELAKETEKKIRKLDPQWYDMRGWRFTKVVQNESGIPRYVVLANRRLELYNKSKEPHSDPQQTIKKLKELLSQNPDSILKRLFYEDMFRASIRARDAGTLIKSGEILLHIDPSDYMLLVRMASTLANKQVMLSEAERYARRAIAATEHFQPVGRTPNTPEEIFNMYFSPDKQREIYRANRAAALDALGWIQFHKRQYRQGEQTLKQSLDLKPTTESRSHLIEVLTKLRKNDEAAILAEELARELEQQVAKRLLNESVDELEFQSSGKAKVALSSLKGQVLLLSFWATWCEPCREELPRLAELARKFGPSDLRIILVPVEDEVSRVKEFLKNSRVDLPVFESLRAKEYFAATVIPTNVIIDNSGRLRYRKVGSGGFEDVREFELVVSKLIREKSAASPRKSEPNR